MAMSDPATDKQVQVVYSAYMGWLSKCVSAEKRSGDMAKAEKMRFFLSANPHRTTFFEEARKYTRSEISKSIEQISDPSMVERQVLFNWMLGQIEAKKPGSIIWITKRMRG